MTAHGTRRSGRRIAVESVWVLLVIAIAGALFLVRYEDPRRISASGDSYWYMRQAQMFAGVSEREASAIASEQVCRDINRSARDRRGGAPSTTGPACVRYNMDGISPRYIAIFGNRPAYPLFAAPFVATLGAWTGMVAATMVLALGVAVLAYLAVWLATGLRLAGVVGSALLFVFPSGFWLTRMLAESAMVLGYLAVLIGAMLLWRRRMIGLPLVAVALVWLFATRSASGAAAALSMLGASVLALLFRAPDRRGPLITGGVAAAALAGWAAISVAFDMPGLNETIQDFATRHFTKPDISDPIAWLYRKNLEYWPIEGRRILVAPWQILAGIAAAVILLRRTGQAAWLWIVLGVTGLMMMIAHPADGEYDRMMVPLWLPIAAAFGFALALAFRSRERVPGAAATVPGKADDPRPGGPAADRGDPAADRDDPDAGDRAAEPEKAPANG